MDATPLDPQLHKAWQAAWDALGAEPLLCAPLLTMRRELFPDPWRDDLDSARRMLARVAAYLSMDDPLVSVIAVGEDGEKVAPRLGHGLELPVWLDEVEGDKIQVALMTAGLAKVELMVPSLVRALVHAALVQRGLLTRSDHTSALIDVAGIFWGFGIILTHGAHVMSKRSSQVRYLQLTSLSPLQMTQSLALFAHARRLDAKARKEIAKALAANQREAFERAQLQIRQQKLGLPASFRELPAPSQWPPMYDLRARVAQGQAAVKALADKPSEQDEGDGVDRGVVGKNAGKPVFMVRRSLAMRVMKFGVGSVFLLSMLSRADPSTEIDTGIMMAGGIAFVLLGGLVGRAFIERRCSDPKCDAKLNDEMKTCPRCKGAISGVIGHPKERLAAAEALGES